MIRKEGLYEQTINEKILENKKEDDLNERNIGKNKKV